MQKRTRFALSTAAVACATLASSTSSQAAFNLFSKDDFSLTMGGFVETDAMWDSTRSFDETIGNKTVLTGPQGASGRDNFTIKNSRFYFQGDYTPTGAWSYRGYMEFDFLGYDQAASENTESGFFNNANLRVRHAYVQATSNGWTFLAGQTWQIFGFQPFYFIPTVDIQPLPGFVYGRTPQIRAAKKLDVADQTHLDVLGGVLRGPERDSGVPDFQAGLRLTYDGWKGANTVSSSATLAPAPLSASVSGLARKIETPDYSNPQGANLGFWGTAISGNIFVPILPVSSDGPQGSLSLTGAFTTGHGYGDQFSSYTGGTAANLNVATNGFAKTDNALRAIDIDGGIGDYDAQGNFHLIQITTWLANLQYVLPWDASTWVDVGYTHLSSSNIAILVGTNGLSSAGSVPYTQDQSFYANVFHDFNPHVRVGAEYAKIRTDYADTEVAINNRYQLQAFFMF